MIESLYLWMAFDAVLVEPGRLCELLDDLNSAGLNITRIDDVEPVRKTYSESTVRQLLTVPPVRPSLPCRILIARGTRCQIGVRACMPKGQGLPSTNVVHVTMKRPTRSDVEVLLGFFDGRLFRRHGVAYAILDTWPEFLKQYVAGGPSERLPGIFWLNWFSERYVEAVGEDVLLSAPWLKTARVADGVACWLYEHLNDVPDDRAQRVCDMESALGQEKFVKGGWQNIPQLAVSRD